MDWYDDYVSLKCNAVPLARHKPYTNLHGKTGLYGSNPHATYSIDQPYPHAYATDGVRHQLTLPPSPFPLPHSWASQVLTLPGLFSYDEQEPEGSNLGRDFTIGILHCDASLKFNFPRHINNGTCHGTSTVVAGEIVHSLALKSYQDY